MRISPHPVPRFLFLQEQFDVPLKAPVEISPGDLQFCLEDHFQDARRLAAFVRQVRAEAAERSARRRLRVEPL